MALTLKAYIQEQLDQLHSDKIADATEVLQYLTAVMRGEHTEQIPLLIGEGVQTLTPKEVGTHRLRNAAFLHIVLEPGKGIEKS